MKVEYTKQNYATIYVKNSLFDTLYYMISRLHVKGTMLLMWGLPLKTKQMNNHSSYNLSLLEVLLL